MNSKFRRKGVAAVEFAILAPILLTMLLSTFELVRYVRARGLVTLSASTMADIVSMQNVVTPGPNGTLRDYCRAIQFTTYPYVSTGITVAVSSYTKNGGVVAKDWENDTVCPTAASPITSVYVPASASYQTPLAAAATLLPNNTDSVIIVQVTLPYTPLILNVVKNMLPISDTMVARPRTGSVSCTGTC